MEIELLSRETIKPSSPTPPHLRIYPLSFIDNFFLCVVPLLFFYNPNDNNDQNSKISQLKKSLSHVLSKYYYFGGRFKDNVTIECNDQGVEFLVTKIKNKLSEILQSPTEKLLNLLFPDELQWTDTDKSAALISIQINCFECGGMAIGICMSHKCGDAATLSNFMNDWSNINKKLEEKEEGLLILPFSLHDGGATIFPQKNIPIFPEAVHRREKTVVCKRFVFQPSMIKFLKEMATSSSIHSPTRVLVVIAWIYKHVVSVMGLNLKTAPFAMAVNLRKRMNPPLSEESVGNMVWFSSMTPDKEEMEVKDLVVKIKEGLSDFSDFYPKLFAGRDENSLSSIYECFKKVTQPKPNIRTVINFTSWCNFPIYEADFGWGKPTWVTTCGCTWKNHLIILMDTSDRNGIVANVNLEENVMAKFEHEVELLQLASLNPINVGQSSDL
ncbi:epi-neemfruitin B synthase L1AT-like [Cicer arietinum]|uniref:Vinorine synthase-like n=1 Tax=Cicer arietinum TaxID=3827 RepID=A0A1S2Z479_CICAR|nr:vinorine synthase-like [Cicer arietinum]